MKKFYLTAIIYPIFTLISIDCHAELFKWVDESGKIHYSDKQPEKSIPTTIVPTGANSTLLSTSTQSSKAIIRPYQATARKLFVTDTVYGWRNNKRYIKPQKIGVYSVGKGCTSRGAMILPDVYIDHPNFFPKEIELAKKIKKVINSLDYDASITSKDELSANLKTPGALSLHSEIVDIKFNSCAPSVYFSDHIKPAGDISSYQFSKHKITLKVNWQLKSGRDLVSVYETSTEAKYNGWNRSGSASLAIKNALEGTLIKLFSNKAFISQVLLENGKDDTEITINTASTIPAKGQFPTHEGRSTQGNIRQSDENIPHIYLISDKNALGQLNPGQTIGVYAYGNTCITFKNKKWPKDMNDYPAFYLSDRGFLNPQRKVLNSLDYKNSISDKYNIVKLRRDTGGYTLHSRITGFRFDSCAPRVTGKFARKRKDRIYVDSYKRNRIHLQIEWTLIGDSEDDILYRGSTEGISDHWLVDGSAAKTMKLAVEDATTQLFSDSIFISKVTQHKNGNGFFSRLLSLVTSGGDKKVDTTTKEKPAVDLNYSSYFLKAHMAQTMATLNGVKMKLTQYYAMNGDWPADIRLAGYTADSFINDKQIENIEIEDNGSLYVQLSDIFGENKMIQLSPAQPGSPAGMTDTWSCSTNVDKKIASENCETM